MKGNIIIVEKVPYKEANEKCFDISQNETVSNDNAEWPKKLEES